MLRVGHSLHGLRADILHHSLDQRAGRKIRAHTAASLGKRKATHRAAQGAFRMPIQSFSTLARPVASVPRI